jgi:LysM repeat protein
MDTISRENNSMLPVGGIIVGVIALLLGGYAAITLAKVNRTIVELDARTAKIQAIEEASNAAAGNLETTRRELAAFRSQMQTNLNEIGSYITSHHTSIAELKESTKKPAVADKGAKKNGEPVVAGPNEYVVKPGDGGTKIARVTGFSVKDIEAVNPGINWSKLAIGQKLKLPAK